ncbi:interactor of HORMAD1 protein 1 isoform X2 [Rhineura floridana]|nr:interactor of HORMAD1 protein 1 isoform X2 [Rhineura floridana]XP_061474855.1 interactor of HORMAD1 protein 1 isoform X2 [Rhineura floridana]XP_061474857.1 interactor of HORMAD1 protein 1 isoform X2 [Rhineura floridana]XP_061474858.1 interactor of HORMAD1 protein 1 isoform X2 [Rhineura floridana]XP_061474859.1 interactor of HORMAD1 protein 1 isoform X2 [Rhineura floridana]XP_061474860.1 interactor of HORMAD1 protein 1 isoform X2 [Rhineura floridana]XP_061474861.1 interactor of HORMAD1 prot
MFSTPIKLGPNKSSSWTSDYNSMSDSQFLFGSQFCPENSQPASAPLEFRHDKSSQQNSQDNEPSIFAKYQSKPQLFGGDGKEKGSLNFPAGGFKGVLEQFEENKKKIKEKHDNEVLDTFILNTKESLQRLQSSLDKFEETLKSVLDALGSLSKTMQETSQSHYELVLNALRDKNEMEQTLLGMEKRLESKDTEISDLKSSLQLLKKGLEQLTSQQNEQHLKLCEQLGHLQLPSILADLQTFISAPRVPNHIKDNVSQTSPEMLMTQQLYDSHLSVLNAPSGSQVISTVTASQGNENVNVQQRSHFLARGCNTDNLLCTCCSSAAISAGSHEESWLLTQEPSQATPLRKVIKRDNRTKGRTTLRVSQFNGTHIDNADSHKNEKLAAESKMQSKGRGSKIKKRKPQKCSQGKRLHSSGKEGNCSNVTNSRKGCSKSDKSQHSCKDTRNPSNSNSGSLVVSQKKMPWGQDGKAKKLKLVLQSHGNEQNMPNIQVTSGLKKRVDPSSPKNNSFRACSSSESSFSQNQLWWFNLSDNYSSAWATPVQQKTTTYCPLFFDSDFSD